MSNGTQILDMSASDLIGRLIINAHGGEFVVPGLAIDARTGQVLNSIDQLDESDGSPAGVECQVMTLNGWTVAHRL